MEGAEEMEKRPCDRKVPKTPTLLEKENKRLEKINGKESW